MSAERTPEQQVLLDRFAAETAMLKARQAQVDQLAAARRLTAAAMRDADITVPDMAKAGGIGTQAVYKILSA